MNEKYEGGCIGTIDSNNKFESKFYLHTDEEDILDYFLFDSETISETFKWT
jgi:hypothetical protein